MPNRGPNPFAASDLEAAALWARPVAGNSGSSSDSDRLNRLARTIEAELLPRLLLAMSSSCRAAGAESTVRRIPDVADVAEFARLLLAHDVPMALAFVDMLRERGAARDRLCLGLFAPAARHLRWLWEQRQCNFDQLEQGLTRLQSIVRQVAAASSPPQD